MSNGDWTREVSPVHQLRRAEGNVETPDGTKPWFLQTIPSEMSVHVGDPLTLNCIIDGDPKPLGKSSHLTYLLNPLCAGLCIRAATRERDHNIIMSENVMYSVVTKDTCIIVYIITTWVE